MCMVCMMFFISVCLSASNGLFVQNISISSGIHVCINCIASLLLLLLMLSQIGKLRDQVCFSLTVSLSQLIKSDL